MAYVIEWSSKLKLNSSDKKSGEDLTNQAEGIEQYYSKASGIPLQDLFVIPGEVTYNHSCLFHPF